VFVEAVINSPTDALAPAATPVTAETPSPPVQVAVQTGISMPGAFPEDDSDTEFLASAPLASGSEPPTAFPNMPGAFPEDDSDTEFLASAPIASPNPSIEVPSTPPQQVVPSATPAAQLTGSNIEMPSPAVEHVAHSAMPPPAAESTSSTIEIEMPSPAVEHVAHSAMPPPAAELTSSTIKLPSPAVEHVDPSVMLPPPAATSSSSTIKLPSPAVEHVDPSVMLPPPAATSSSSTIKLPSPAVEHVDPSVMLPPPAATSSSSTIELPSPAVEHVAHPAMPPPAAELTSSTIELPNPAVEQVAPSAMPPPAAASLSFNIGPVADLSTSRIELPITLPPQALLSATPPPVAELPTPAVEDVDVAAAPPLLAAELPRILPPQALSSATPPAAASSSSDIGPVAELSSSGISPVAELSTSRIELSSPAVEDVVVAAAPRLPVAELPSTLPHQALSSATPPAAASSSSDIDPAAASSSSDIDPAAASSSSDIGPAAELSSNIGPAAELSGSVGTTAEAGPRKFLSFAEAAKFIEARKNTRMPHIIHHDGRPPPVIPPIVKTEPINDSDDEKRTLELGSSALPSTKDANPFAQPRPQPAVAPLTAAERRILNLSPAAPLSTVDAVPFGRPPTQQAVAPLTPDQKHFQIYMDMPDDEDWASQKPIVSSVQKQVTIARSVARNARDTYWLIKKGKTKPKIKSRTLVSDQHQVPKMATAVSPTSLAAWACPSVHHEGVAAGFISYNPGFRGSCYGCHSPKNQHAKVQDWSIPAGIRIFQISELYFADGFGNVRLKYGKYHPRRGNSAAPLAYYEAINTGLGKISKDQFIGLTYYTEAELRAGDHPKRRTQSAIPTSMARSRSRTTQVSQSPMRSQLTAEPDTPDVDSEAEFDKPRVNSEDAAVGKHERDSHDETPLSYSRKRTKMSPAAEEHVAGSEDRQFFDFSDSRKPGPSLEELLQAEDVDSDKSETELDKPGVDSQNAGKHEHDSHDKTSLSYSRKRMKMSPAAKEHVGSSEDWHFEMDASKIDSAALDADIQAALAEEHAREDLSDSGNPV
jgi:hypothetical protein